LLQVGYDGTLPATLLSAVRYFVGTITSSSAEEDPELAVRTLCVCSRLRVVLRFLGASSLLLSLVHPQLSLFT
jgi:hypothetical protein